MYAINKIFIKLRIIVSPSGKLYGSENVLFDFLKNSSLKFDVIHVPKKSQFKEKLELNNFKTKGFSNVKLLYFSLLLELFIKKVKSFYCNEAGHVRYIAILAQLFPKVNFVVHVRILEDTLRIKKTFRNLQFVAISKTILQHMNNSASLVYDGYHFTEKRVWNLSASDKLKIGIVGRVTSSKGIDLFTQAFIQGCGPGIEFHFYGDVDIEYEKTDIFQHLRSQKNVYFNGFVSDKNLIYTNINVLMHVNENEPLGRIFFEILDYGKPFIGINKGGIAEIANQINYPYVFEKEQLAIMLNGLRNEQWEFDFHRLENSRKIVLRDFGIEKYTRRIDCFLI